MNSQNQDKLNFYTQYLQQLELLSAKREPITYNWVEEPPEISGIWMQYFLLLDEYARELANEINYLNEGLRRLAAWDKVMAGLTDDQILVIWFEFINSLGTHLLLLPNAIKARFAFAVAKFSHYANRTKFANWRDEFPPDDKIHMNTADEFAAGWKKYGNLKSALEKIDAKEFKVKTAEFRNTFAHRYPPALLFGHKIQIVRVTTPPGKVEHQFVEIKPLQIKNILVLLRGERDLCFTAFEKFQDLVREQIEEILKSQKI